MKDIRTDEDDPVTMLIRPNDAEFRSANDPFRRTHKLLRLVWGFVWAVGASWTPPSFWRWRRFLLRLFGASMGEKADVRAGARVWYPPNLVMEDETLLANGVNCYNQAKITVCMGSIVSQGAHLCSGSHDVDRADFAHYALPITIDAGAWIAAEAFVGPGVTVGAGAVLGARGVAFRSLDPQTIYAGNPAKAIRRRKNVAPL